MHIFGSSPQTAAMRERHDDLAPGDAFLYEEGALLFPCVRVQRDYRNVDDIIRICRRRIRGPEQWYGDYLASIGARASESGVWLS